ncbi:hypothetical protein IFM89_035268 [Coptis chinensis]|uniref:Peroxisomal membrane protein PMP22 n=1 Tax=Coptis chinensis TaxID=261450 RepID=A0A835H2L9_9MAGN|nr:hypothetical protein IFM89_035268 [Coptis chinensis]
MSELAKKGWEQYMLQLQHHPLRTKAITAGVLSGISDSVAQKLSGIQKLQLKRLLLKVVTLLVHKLRFTILQEYRSRSVVIMYGYAPLGKPVSKVMVFLEQLTSSPLNNMMFLMYYGLVVEGRPWVQVRSKVKKDYPSVQLTSWMFWPIVGWVNHLYMPLQFRVIFHSFVACCWGIFLNLRARSMALTKG